MIAEKGLPRNRRNDACGRIQELAPAMVSKTTPGLILQLGGPSVDVRRAALELLQMILEDTRPRCPGRLPASDRRRGRRSRR